MAGRKSSEELIVIAKTYDLILWSCNHTGKFPRNHRFVLGERIERKLLWDQVVSFWQSRIWANHRGYDSDSAQRLKTSST
jgi:hypothetical protein